MADDDDLEGYRVVGTYSDFVIANLARAKLTSVGIRSHLKDEEVMAIGSLIAPALGGVKVLTAAADAEDARAILQALDAQEDDHEADVLDPRCPECDSPYLRNVRGKVRCERCGYKGTIEATAGRAPYRATALRKGDPVFRLVRRHVGLGVFVGLVLGAFLLLFLSKHVSSTGAYALFSVVLVVCAFAGYQTRIDVCSRPKCRTKLPPELTTCPECKGHIEGEIKRAREHHARRAAWLKNEALLPRK